MNVRLSEGGAAGVARTLAEELTGRGIECAFAYGYATGGRSSSLVTNYESLRVTPGPIAAANRFHYSVRGRETKLRGPVRWSSFLKAVDSSDVIHLHAIHSHIVDTGVLFRTLIEARKPVVWTLHDQWAMTGRCAQPGTCRLWETGCAKCPDLSAYPPAKIDRAAQRWQERREMIEALQTAVPTAVVACASWLAKEAEKTSIRNVRVITNSVDRAFWGATDFTRRLSRHGQGIRNLFICRDLRDERKVDWETLAQVSALPEQSLTIVGDHAPHEIIGATRVAATSDRVELARLIQEHDRLVFTSPVDYFPLTIVEALTSGLEVCALDSQAAREFAHNPGLHIFSDTQSLVKHLMNAPLPQASFIADETERNYFSPERMTNEYVSVYEELLGR